MCEFALASNKGSHVIIINIMRRPYKNLAKQYRDCGTVCIPF